MEKATRAQWIKCAIVILLYLAFLVWVKSWWGLIVVPFIFDIYITKKVPWSFWKKSKNSTVRSIMSWVDAIVFALVAVYFVNIYVFQNYQIPSSSLEKSLLVGDFLYVSKMSYGPRVPNTPLSMPLAQHTLPLVNTKSYIEWPQWKYKRVPGFGKVKMNDIVVFNFPAGDTVAVTYQQTDFYDNIIYREGKGTFSNPINMDSLNRKQQRIVYDLYRDAGRKYVFAHPEKFGNIIYRPVDRRENYVKRCLIPTHHGGIRWVSSYPKSTQHVACTQRPCYFDRTNLNRETLTRSLSTKLVYRLDSRQLWSYMDTSQRFYHHTNNGQSSYL